MTWAPRRFWKSAQVEVEAAGYGIRLDTRPLRTPAGVALLVPTAALAREIAAEWDALEEKVDPARLPFTRSVNAAIDRVAPNPEPVIATIAAYGGSDLLCYRAEGPRALIERQAEAWDPWLAWSAATLGAPLATITGVIPRDQPAESLAALHAAVARYNAFGLTALHDLVALSGSLVLGLAVAAEALDGADAWDISRLDEIWQAEQWGADAEAEEAAATRRADFIRSAEMICLLGNSAQLTLIH